MQVKLSEFLNQILSRGEMIVARQIADFQQEDLDEAVGIIRSFYLTDRLEMPHQAPAFDEPAALWAAQYLYRAVQFILMREVEADVIAAHLKPFEGEVNPSAVYSVDLMLRHFGVLVKFSSGISPDDPLVILLKQTAAAWPFSSVGLNIPVEAGTEVIFSHPSLKYTYADRIIQHRDSTRLTGENEITTINEIMGLHQAQLWPGFELIKPAADTIQP